MTAVAADTSSSASLAEALYQKGLALEKDDDLPAALIKYEASRKAAAALGDQRRLAQSLLGIGLVHQRWGDFRKATELYQTAARWAEMLDDPVLLCRAFTRIGEIHERQSRYREAKTYFEKAQRLAETARDDRQIGWVWLGLGTVYVHQGDAPQAREYYEKALRRIEDLGDKPLLAEMLARIGYAYYNQGLYERVIDYCQKALAAWESLGEPRAIVQALNNLGSAYRNPGSYAEALACYQKALRIASELGDRRLIAWTETYLGSVYWEQGSYPEAVGYYQRAQDVMRELGDKGGLAHTLTYLGVLEWAQGSFGEAVVHLQRAQAIWEEVGNKSGVARALSDLGLLYEVQGSYRDTVACFQRARKLREEMRDTRGVAEMLSRLGSTYQQQGASTEAAAVLSKALKLYEGLDDKRGLIATLISLGSLYPHHGSSHTAISHLRRALRIAEELGGRWETAWTLDRLAEVYGRLGLYAETLAAYQRSLDIGLELQAKSHVGYVFSYIGYTHLRQQKYAEALPVLNQALAVGESIKEPMIVWRAHYYLAGAYEKLGDTDQALKHYRQAVDEIEKVRARAGSDEGRAAFLENQLSVYEDLVRLLYTLDAQRPSGQYGPQAFEYAERAKARVLLDSLAEARTHIRKGLTAEQQAAQRKLFRKISQVQSELQAGSLSPDRRESLLAELARSEEALAQFIADLRAHNPDYARLHYPEPYRLAPLQRGLGGDSALIEFFLGDAQSFVFAVTDKDFRMAVLPERAVIRKQVDRYRQLISRAPASSRAQDPAKLLATCDRAAHALFKQLIGPIQDLIRDKQRLILVLDGILYYVPFETLRVEPPRSVPNGSGKRPAGRYLIETHVLTYAPSASVWGSLKREAGSGKREAGRERKDWLAFADPMVRPDWRLRGSGAVRGVRHEMDGIARGLYDGTALQFPPLPHTRLEVEGIRALYPKHRQTVYMGAAATEARVKHENLAAYRVIHFATHAVIDEHVPRRSGVVLSLVEKGEEDGVLQMHEIFNLDLDAELVVLSACQTGLGKLVKGEGMVSLVRAFLYAGAENVVVSLWSVDDKSTAELMKTFYQHLKAGKNAAEALRQAKLQMIRAAQSGKTYAAYAYPYYWGAFTLTGPGR